MSIINNMNFKQDTQFGESIYKTKWERDKKLKEQIMEEKEKVIAENHQLNDQIHNSNALHDQQVQ